MTDEPAPDIATGKSLEAATEASAAAAISAAIDTWMHESFAGSVVAQNTQVWNVVFAAKDDLKQRLAALFKEG